MNNPTKNFKEALDRLEAALVVYKEELDNATGLLKESLQEGYGKAKSTHNAATVAFDMLNASPEMTMNIDRHVSTLNSATANLSQELRALDMDRDEPSSPAP